MRWSRNWRVGRQGCVCRQGRERRVRRLRSICGHRREWRVRGQRCLRSVRRQRRKGRVRGEWSNRRVCGQRCERRLRRLRGVCGQRRKRRTRRGGRGGVTGAGDNCEECDGDYKGCEAVSDWSQKEAPSWTGCESPNTLPSLTGHSGARSAPCNTPREMGCPVKVACLAASD